MKKLNLYTLYLQFIRETIPEQRETFTPQRKALFNVFKRNPINLRNLLRNLIRRKVLE